MHAHPHIPVMARYVGLFVALFLGLAASAAQALTLETLSAPDGGPKFTDPDERRPFAPLSGGDERNSTVNPNGSGFNFSFSGNSNGQTRFIPGYTVPGQYGPAIDPQTRMPYPR
jgi:hypothetical protein